VTVLTVQITYLGSSIPVYYYNSEPEDVPGVSRLSPGYFKLNGTIHTIMMLYDSYDSDYVVNFVVVLAANIIETY
jgi:hypothetical protein